MSVGRRDWLGRPLAEMSRDSLWRAARRGRGVPFFAALASTAALLATSACEGWGREERLIVRTTLPVELREHVESAFEAAEPTVDVRFTVADAATSFDELARAPGQVPFDVWWGAPELLLARAGDAGHLLRHRSAWSAEGGGAEHGEPAWQRVLSTPFVIAFNREALGLSRAPRDWIDLFHFRWTEEVWALDPEREPDGAYFVGAILLESLRDDGDLDRGFDWLLRLDEQVGRYTRSPGEAIRALESGGAMLAIVPLAAVDSARARGEDWAHYRLPESGTPLLTRGVAIIDGTQVEEGARRFVDFLGSDEVAAASAASTRWVPAREAPRTATASESGVRGATYALALDTLVAELDGWIERWALGVSGR